MNKITGVLLVAALAITSHMAVARDLSLSEKRIIEDSARQHLKDPDSAKFFWQDYKGGSTYCAHVNSKNSYGGYSGKALLLVGLKFDGKGKLASAETYIHEGEMKEMMSPICTKAGYQP